MKNSLLRSTAIITGLALVVISGCAKKLPVLESQPMDTAAEETTVVDETAASAAAESGVQIIPLDPSAAPIEPPPPPAEPGTEAAPQDPPAAEAPPAEEKPKKPDVTPPNVGELTRQLIGHRNTLWRSRTSTYRFYLGGILSAEYSLADKTLTINKDGGELSCKYAADGKLEIEGSGKQNDCSVLANRLKDYLATT